MSNRIRTLGVNSILTAVLLFGGVAIAQADPADCTAPNPSLAFSSGNKITVRGKATCSTTSTRTWRVEAKYQKTFSPDPTVGGSRYSSKGKKYDRTFTSCDDGQAHPYYGRSFFTTNAQYHDSATRDHRSCG